MSTLARALSTLGPIGHVRFGPGTLAAAATLVCGYGVALVGGTVAVAILTVTVALVGQWAIASRGDGAYDPREVVIDEAAGQLVAMIGIGSNLLMVGLAFGLFRVFDIWKPWPIRLVERRGGPWAVLGDDLLAGFMVRVVVAVVEVTW